MPSDFARQALNTKNKKAISLSDNFILHNLSQTTQLLVYVVTQLQVMRLESHITSKEQNNGYAYAYIFSLLTHKYSQISKILANDKLVEPFNSISYKNINLNFY